MGTGNSDYEIGKPGHDYTKDLIATKGSRERNYLQVKDRMRLLRELFPEAKVTTTVLNIDPANGFAAFHARVELPNGAIGEGTGSETARDFGDYIEKAETKAVGRACSAAGIGHQFGIADFEYEGESPKPYNGVDTGVSTERTRNAPPAPSPAPNVLQPRAAAQQARQAAAPATANEDVVIPQTDSKEDQEQRSAMLLRFKETLGLDMLRAKSKEMFDKELNWREFSAAEQVLFLTWAFGVDA